MRHLKRTKLSVGEIIKDCSSSYRDQDLREKFLDSTEFITKKSVEYKEVAENGNWEDIAIHDMVNESITTHEMVALYTKKFAGHPATKDKYYNKILALAESGKCPICGIGQVSTLDHYLAKTLYPTYAVTPDNLIPTCKDCNFSKHDSPVSSINDAPLHPYFEDIDKIVWLCADLSVVDGILVAKYYVNTEIAVDDDLLYKRICKHLKLYKLQQAYTVQASTEISENMEMWKNVYSKGGKDGILKYFSECLTSYELVQKNTWKTALIRGLISAVNKEIMEPSVA